jgi:putative transposase
VYLATRRLLELVVMARSDDAKEIELPRTAPRSGHAPTQVKRPSFDSADRAFLAVLCRLLPRARWGAFIVTPATLLAWHGRIVAPALDLPTPSTGTPPSG